MCFFSPDGLNCLYMLQEVNGKDKLSCLQARYVNLKLSVLGEKTDCTIFSEMSHLGDLFPKIYSELFLINLKCFLGHFQ